MSPPPSAGRRKAKLLVFIPKRFDISEERFRRHWRTTHAQFALKISSLERYVQNHRLQSTPEAFPPAPFGLAPFSGVSEAWLADVRSVDAMGADPEYVDGARLDEPNFMDVASKCNLICHEFSLAGTSARHPDAVKTFLMLRCPAGVPLREFNETWSDPTRWRRVQDAFPLQNLALNRPAPAGYVNRRPAPFDLVIEAWWQAGSRWDSALSAAIGLFDSPDRTTAGSGSVALAANEIRFL